jgi:hypothetical protein
MADEHATSGRPERRLREIDAVIETIVLAQAACEGWIYGAYRRTGVTPACGGGWVQRWVDAPLLICDRQMEPSQPTRPLDETTEQSLRRLSTWRNFLLHGDERAQRNLHRLVPAGHEAEHLVASFAEDVIVEVDAAFTDAGSLLGVHGTPGLHSAFLWVAPDEYS